MGGVLRFIPMNAVVWLVGWLDRSSQVVPNVLVSGWLSWGSGGAVGQ